jgi:IS66 C-terminal element
MSVFGTKCGQYIMVGGGQDDSGDGGSRRPCSRRCRMASARAQSAAASPRRSSWALVASLVATGKLNGVEPQAWLTDVLERMVSGQTKAHELERLLPWIWKAERLAPAIRT